MIILWLAILVFLQSVVTLVLGPAQAEAAWVQWLLVMVVATLLVQLAYVKRRLPLFGVRGQELIIAALLVLLLAEGGWPGHPGIFAQWLGLDETVKNVLAAAARLALLLGMWSALSHLAYSLQRGSMRMPESGFHNALTELAPRPDLSKLRQTVLGQGEVVDTTTGSHAAHRGASRVTHSGLTISLKHALEQVSDAHSVLRNTVLRSPDNIAARLALHRRLSKHVDDRPAFFLHAADFISALRIADRYDMALSIVVECAQAAQDYYPPNDVAFDLAQYAQTQGYYQVVLRILRHFDIRNPGHQDIPRALLHSAQALVGLHMGQPAQAILRGLIGNFPDSDLVPEAMALSSRLAVQGH